MVHNADNSITRAKKLIQNLYELNLLSVAEADQAKQEYIKFIGSVVVTTKERFLAFDKDAHRLDSFMGSLMQGNQDFIRLWKVSKKES